MIIRRVLKKVFKWFIYFLIIPISYLIISLILTYITVNKTDSSAENEKVVYLSTNGVHLDIVIPIQEISENLKKDLKFTSDEKYFSFGWGDENFYLNTPTWNDLTFKNAFQAMFLESSTLMHLTRYKKKRESWVRVELSELELNKVNQYILESFKENNLGSKIGIQGYLLNDNFYKANGSYSCFKTCNSWANDIFKKSGLKSWYWTPVEFGLIN
jgi:uncharacterized protein (TIGR02117 family)